MAQDPKLESLVDRLIAQGASDEDITFAIDDYKKNPAAWETSAPEKKKSSGILPAPVMDFFGGVANRVRENVGGVVELAKAAKDVAGNVADGYGMESLAGAWEGAKAGPGQLLESIKSGEALRELIGGGDKDTSWAEQAGRGTTDIAAMLLGGGLTSAAKAGLKQGARAGLDAALTPGTYVPRWGAKKDTPPPPPPSPLPGGGPVTGTGTPVVPITPAGPLTASPTTGTGGGSITVPKPSSTVPAGFGAPTQMGVPQTRFDAPMPLTGSISVPAGASKGKTKAAKAPKPKATPAVEPDLNLALPDVSDIRSPLQGRSVTAEQLMDQRGGPEKSIIQLLAEGADEAGGKTSADVVSEAATVPPQPGRFKLPEVANPEEKLAAAQRAGIGPEPVPEQVHLDSAARLAERRAKEGTNLAGPERRAENLSLQNQIDAELANLGVKVEGFDPSPRPAAGVLEDLEVGGKRLSDTIRAKIESERRNFEMTGEPWGWDFNTNRWTPGGRERLLNDLPYNQTEALADAIEREMQGGPKVQARLQGESGKQSLNDKTPEQLIAENPPVREGVGQYEDFRADELDYAGRGEPGLKVEEGVGGFERVIVFRGQDGQPLASARVVTTPDGPQVFSVASSKSGGLGAGRALIKVIEEVKKLNPVGVIGGLSPDAQAMVTRLGARKVSPEVKGSTLATAPDTAPDAGLPKAASGRIPSGKTKTVAEMVQEYGPEEAARRARMTVPEVELEADPALKAGYEQVREAYYGATDRAAKTGSEGAKKLAKEVGKLSAANAKALGLAKDNTGNVSEAGKRSLKQNMARAGGGDPTLYAGIDPRALWDFAKRHPVIAGGAAGGALGANMDEEDPLRGLGMGAAGGAALGLGASKGLTNIYIDTLLGGGATLKNIAQGVGVSPRIAAGMPSGTPMAQRMAPIKEMLRVPTNVKEFGKAFVNPPALGPATATTGRKPNLFFGRLIGALDEMKQKELQRAGIDKDLIDHNLLTSETQGGRLTDMMKRFPEIFPFLRVPMNAFIEGGNNIANAVGRNHNLQQFPQLSPGRRKAMTAASFGAGGVAEAWVRDGDSPEERMQRATIVATLLPLLGPDTLAGSLGIGTAGVLRQKLTDQPGLGAASRIAMGGMSPIPDIAFDPISSFPPNPLRFWRRLFTGRATPEE